MMKEIQPIDGSFVLEPLPYIELGTAISANTLSFHHGKHLRAYVDNMNKALPGSGLEGVSLQEVVRRAEGGLFNNAGQTLNHLMYFQQFSIHATPMDQVPAIRDLIVRDFGSEEAFRTAFEQKGATLFGSGWVWLSQQADGHLVISQEANAGNPLRSGMKPLLTFDVWEHAYYLDHQNRRADYLAALWPYVDWQIIAERIG